MGSRWLDPSEVAKGPEMRTCVTNPLWPHGFSRCPFPATHGDWCACHNFGAQVTSLPPSPLVAAPRWEGKPPRARRGMERHGTGKAEWSWSMPGLAYPWKTKRVRKVSEGTYTCKWVFA